jgi:hypothetical protein
MIRVVAWVQILFVLGCVGYSTYWLFQGNFEQAFLPYPILILYYLLFSRRKMKKIRPSKGEDANV